MNGIGSKIDSIRPLSPKPAKIEGLDMEKRRKVNKTLHRNFCKQMHDPKNRIR